MEMLDVFDVNGNLLGVESRQFCHSENPGVYHKAVWIWLKNSKGQVLVQQRSRLKKHGPLKWDMSAGGHVDAGESQLSTCVREVKEELGIEVAESDFVFLKEIVNQRSWELSQVYLLKSDVGENQITLQEEEVEQVKWLDFEVFEKLIYADEFCNHSKEYKDWVVATLKKI